MTLCPVYTGPCGSVEAAEVDDMSDGVPLPLITVTSSAPTADDAAKLATIDRLGPSRARSPNNKPPPARRPISASSCRRSRAESPATLAQGHSKSIPILVLFAIVSASIALAFIRNNHSEDPVRSTRRRLDEGLAPDDGRGVCRRRQWSDSGARVRPGSHREWKRCSRLGLRRAGSAPRLAEEENAAPQRAATDEPSATHRRRAWSDRQPPHFLRGPGFERESRD